MVRVRLSISARVQSGESTRSGGGCRRVEVRVRVSARTRAVRVSRQHEVEVGLLSEDPYPSFNDTLRLFNNETVLELRLFLEGCPCK